MRCSKCGAQGTSGRKFCPECGSPLSNLCAKCGADNSPSAKFCEDCGAAFGAPATVAVKKFDEAQIRVAETSDPENLDGERKTVTALFADIKGSMELIEDLDPEEARAIVDPALKLMMEAVHHYGGYVAQSTGDGIFALFGAPIAHEDHPQRALFAALRMQEELKRYSDKLRERGEPPISIRVGVNVGEVVVRTIKTGETHTEYAPIGHAVSLASRLQALATPGSIAISGALRKFVEGYFTLKGLGRAPIKGVSEPVEVYEVTGLGPLRTRLQRSAGRGYTKFVGRNREIDAMKHGAEQAIAGHGQIVAAMAEPGVGKSRLLFEFKAVSQSGWTTLETFSVSHGKASAYLPVIDLLHSYFEIASEDDARRRRQKILGKLLELDRALEDTIPYLYALLGIVEGDDPLAQMDAQIKSARTLEAIKRLLLRESLNQPLMVIFEDLHWIDDETQEFLNLLADSIGTARILLLVNYRPEYSHRWNSKTYYTQLRLDPLGRESAEEMLSSILGDGKDLVPLKRLIIEKTEGNPFFMEETIEVLLDDGALVRNGSTKLIKPLAKLKIPSTVQGILASRIDRLPPDEKNLLQTLAVIGRDFAFDLLQRVITRPQDELNGMLHALQLAEFIYEQPTAGAEVEYTFKHALTQEVAYNSLLFERRRMLHAQVAQAVESIPAAKPNQHLSALAYHYGRSDEVIKAIEYARLAGEDAAKRFAYGEALTHFRAGLERLAKVPNPSERMELELPIQMALAACLTLSEGPAAPAIKGAYLRARECCEAAGDDLELFAVINGMRWFYGWRGELRTALQCDEEMLGLALKRNDPRLELVTLVNRGIDRQMVGEFNQSREDLERALVLSDSVPPHLNAPYLATSPRAIALCFLAWGRWTLGYPSQAMQSSEALITAARALSDPFLLATVLYFASHLQYLLRDPRAARRFADEALSLGHSHGFGLELARTSIVHSWAIATEGDAQRGLSEISSSLSAYDATGAMMFTSNTVVAVDAYLKIRRLREGLELLDRALSTSVRADDHASEAELYRIRGELLLASKSSLAPEAERCFLDAIAIARRQNARSWELRATTSLAKVLDQQGKRDEARAMLSEIYNWFSEGFDTADLMDAKALLDELATVA
jgi:class 3 adenylate cyclase/tetratricopeptide (TPR) repeat protein